MHSPVTKPPAASLCLLDLPRELLDLIVTHLNNHHDLLSLTLTCRSLRHSARLRLRWTISRLSSLGPLVSPFPDIGDTLTLSAPSRTDNTRPPRLLRLDVHGPASLPTGLEWCLNMPHMASFVSEFKVGVGVEARVWDPARWLKVTPTQPGMVNNPTEIWATPGHSHYWTPRDSARYVDTVNDINPRLLGLFGGNQGVRERFGVSGNLLALDWYPDDDETGQPLLTAERNWTGASRTNLYTAMLCSSALLPNLREVTFTLLETENEARALLRRTIMDMENLQHLTTVTLTSEGVDGWRNTIGFDVVYALLSRPKLKALHHLILAEDSSETALPASQHTDHTTASNVRRLTLAMPARPRQADGHDAVHPYTWPSPTAVISQLSRCTLGLRQLKINEDRRGWALGWTSPERDQFRRLLGDVLRARSANTLRVLNLNTAAMGCFSDLGLWPPRQGKEQDKEKIMCPDGTERWVYNLGGSIGSLQSFVNLRNLHIDLAHLLGRRYFDGAQMTLLETVEKEGGDPAPSDRPYPRVLLIPQFLPPNLTLLELHSGIKFAPGGIHPTSDPIITHCRKMFEAAVQAILDGKKTWTWRLQELWLPESFIPSRASPESRTWTRKARAVGLRISWAEDETMTWEQQAEWRGVWDMDDDDDDEDEVGGVDASDGVGSDVLFRYDDDSQISEQDGVSVFSPFYNARSRKFGALSEQLLGYVGGGNDA